MIKSSLLCKGIILALSVGNSIALSTTSLSARIRPNILLRSSPADDDDATLLNPRPPQSAPVVDEQLQIDLMESERRILMYEAEINMVREQLDLKQDDLQEERNRFRSEKSSLLEKITEFSSLLSQRDEELEKAEQQEQQEPQSPEQIEKVNDLIEQVKTLSGDLDAKAKKYMTEQETTKALRKRFEAAQDTLEFEQMRFEKEKRALQKSIDEEKNSLKRMADKVKQSQESFDLTKKGLIDRIQDEEEKFKRAKQSWSETQSMMEAVERELRESLKEKEEKVAQSSNARKYEQELWGSELEELRAKLVQEQDKATRTVDELLVEKERFEQEKKSLEAIVKQERKEIEKLQAGLLKEEEKFEKERLNLEEKLSQETDKLKEIEEELAGERDTFSQEKERLEKQVEEEVRVRQLKKRVMNERFTEIRREMTELWENSKRQARKEEARLKNKYERKLADVKKNVVRLEGRVEETDATNVQLTARLADARRENEELVFKTEQLETKYKSLLSKRDDIINNQSTIIEEQKKTIEGYESSFRLLARLSLRVTGTKIKNVGGKLTSFLQNSPKKKRVELDEDVSEFE